MELISAYPPPPGLMEREGPDTSASRAIAARATAAVRANNDLLIDQLRRICRAANVETSIGDSAAELRLKLQARAPAKLVSTLQDSMRSPRPMFKLQPMPRACRCRASRTRYSQLGSFVSCERQCIRFYASGLRLSVRVLKRCSSHTHTTHARAQGRGTTAPPHSRVSHDTSYSDPAHISHGMARSPTPDIQHTRCSHDPAPSHTSHSHDETQVLAEDRDGM